MVDRGKDGRQMVDRGKEEEESFHVTEGSYFKESVRFAPTKYFHSHARRMKEAPGTIVKLQNSTK